MKHLWTACCRPDMRPSSFNHTIHAVQADTKQQLVPAPCAPTTSHCNLPPDCEFVQVHCYIQPCKVWLSEASTAIPMLFDTMHTNHQSARCCTCSDWSCASNASEGGRCRCDIHVLQSHYDFVIHEVSHDELYTKPKWFLELNPAGLIPVIAWQQQQQQAEEGSSRDAAPAAVCAIPGIVSITESLVCNEFLEDSCPSPAVSEDVGQSLVCHT